MYMLSICIHNMYIKLNEMNIPLINNHTQLRIYYTKQPALKLKSALWFTWPFISAWKFAGLP